MAVNGETTAPRASGMVAATMAPTTAAFTPARKSLIHARRLSRPHEWGGDQDHGEGRGEDAERGHDGAQQAARLVADEHREIDDGPGVIWPSASPSRKTRSDIQPKRPTASPRTTGMMT